MACYICGLVVPKKNESVHKYRCQKRHPDRVRAECSGCSLAFPSRQELFEHKKTCVARCPVCSKAFSNVSNMRKHVKFSHRANSETETSRLPKGGNIKLNCDHCGYKVVTRQTMSQHMIVKHLFPATQQRIRLLEQRLACAKAKYQTILLEKERDHARLREQNCKQIRKPLQGHSAAIAPIKKLYFSDLFAETASKGSFQDEPTCVVEEPARHSKLEKADILKMTDVKQESLQSSQQSAKTTDNSAFKKFNEASREDLLAQPSNFENVSKVGSPPPQLPPSPFPPATTPHPIATPAQLPPGFTISAEVRLHATHDVLGSIQLMPTRLANGEIALVLPSHHANMFQSAATPASSTPSLPPLAPSSRQHQHPSTSSPSPLSMRSRSVSPTSSPLSPPMQEPLSLVTKRSSKEKSKSCWRPWSDPL